MPHLPAAPETVASYLIHLLEERRLHVARGTIVDVASSAVADIHRFTDDHQPQRSGLVKAVKKAIVRLTKPPKEKRPITGPILYKIRVSFLNGSKKGKRDYFMILLCYKGFLRQSEAAALGPEDLWIEWVITPSGHTRVLFVFIEKSKNDQGRVGHTVVLQEDPKRWKCPVETFLDFKRSFPSRPHQASFFTSVNHPFGQLCSSHVNSALKAACTGAGIPKTQFSSHCLRVQ